MKTVELLKNTLEEYSKERNRADYEFRVSCIERVAETLKEASALEKTLEFLRLYGEGFEPFVCEDLFIAGTSGIFMLPPEMAGLTGDIGHYCADYDSLVNEGVGGIRSRITSAIPTDELGTENKAGFLRALDLFTDFMRRHADAAEEKSLEAGEEERKNLLRMASDIRVISERKPETFLQGLQLVWFAHSYLHLKPYTCVLTLGNMDRTLIELYNADTEKGELNADLAREYICHFYLAFKTMCRDTQNLVVGGSDEQGNGFENDLTHLFLQAQTAVTHEQPSVSIKINEYTSDTLWEDALDLLARGGAMPAFLNDKLLISSLIRSGFEEEESNTFCNVGCYEATPYGNTFGGTVSGRFFLVEQFCEFYAQNVEYPSFEELYSAWHGYLTQSYVVNIVPQYAAAREDISKRSASPFCACIMDGCIESLRLPEQYGAKNNIFSIMIGGLGTVVDSLLCVKHFVYDTKTWSYGYLRDQVVNNYPDADVASRLRAYPDRFGSCSEYSSALAANEAEFLSELICSNPINDKVKMLPALFLWFADIFTENVSATPDGRRTGDRCSYGAAASELLSHRDITKVLMSTAKLPLELFPVGAPNSVNLVADMLRTKKGRTAVRRMIETYFAEGGTHVHINVADPDTLRDAQIHPELYKDLLIRISGHTEPYNRLNKTMQDTLIARAELGC